MLLFTPGQAVISDQPRVVVAPGLKPGRYRFQLVVCSSTGRRSAPSEWIITVHPAASPPEPTPPSRQRAFRLAGFAGMLARLRGRRFTL